MNRATVLIVALAVVPVITQAAVTERARYLMGTVCEVAVPEAHEAAIEKAFAEAARIEAMLSTWTDTSELAGLNAGRGTASPELRALLDRAEEWSQRTNGAFDPRVKALIDVWRTRDEGAIPDAAELAQALQDRSRYEEGGFGKGYAIDRMLAITDAPSVMINFGGQIAVRGEIGVTIADPADRNHPVIAFTLRSGSLSTSSGSEKTFVVDGRRFSHIIDPRTGEALPPRGSVSVISDDALTADILSTALYVMGEDDGLRWANEHGVAAIYITPEKHIRRSAAARERVRALERLDRHFSEKD